MKTMLKAICVCSALGAQAPSQAHRPPSAGLAAPALQPGEGFAMASADGASKGFGEAAREDSMGSLAMLLWLRLEGEEWAAKMVSFKCKGELNGLRCWNRKGHGKVDLAKATAESCNLAFLVWSLESAERWKKDYGEGAAKYRLEQVFKPFWGNRVKAGETIPAMGPEWIGDGDLLRTTPLAMAKWLADPDQEPLLSLCKRLMSGAFDGWITKGAEWWFKTGLAPSLPGANDPKGLSTWVAGANGEHVVVLHLPKADGRLDILARLKAILLLPKK
ncbi:MAG: hypothetical protein IPQ13_02325 [Holophagaceae bacterium]|nr:hypothetical protein [Holophagaceae bacterium]